MIDFKDNILYFGDGDILVNNSIGGLMFVNCKPPLEVGTELTEELREELGVKYTSDWIIIPIYAFNVLYNEIRIRFCISCRKF
jgi:hypothetical protein